MATTTAAHHHHHHQPPRSHSHHKSSSLASSTSSPQHYRDRDRGDNVSSHASQSQSPYRLRPVASVDNDRDLSGQDNNTAERDFSSNTTALNNGANNDANVNGTSANTNISIAHSPSASPPHHYGGTNYGHTPSTSRIPPPIIVGPSPSSSSVATMSSNSIPPVSSLTSSNDHSPPTHPFSSPRHTNLPSITPLPRRNSVSYSPRSQLPHAVTQPSGPPPPRAWSPSVIHDINPPIIHPNQSSSSAHQSPSSSSSALPSQAVAGNGTMTPPGRPSGLPAPPTGHELMAMFPPKSPLNPLELVPSGVRSRIVQVHSTNMSGVERMNGGVVGPDGTPAAGGMAATATTSTPTSGWFEKQERAFFAKAGREIIRLGGKKDGASGTGSGSGTATGAVASSTSPSLLVASSSPGAGPSTVRSGVPNPSPNAIQRINIDGERRESATASFWREREMREMREREMQEREIREIREREREREAREREQFARRSSINVANHGQGPTEGGRPNGPNGPIVHGSPSGSTASANISSHHSSPRLHALAHSHSTASAPSSLGREHQQHLRSTNSLSTLANNTSSPSHTNSAPLPRLHLQMSPQIQQLVQAQQQQHPHQQQQYHLRELKAENEAAQAALDHMQSQMGPGSANSSPSSSHNHNRNYPARDNVIRHRESMDVDGMDYGMDVDVRRENVPGARGRAFNSPPMSGLQPPHLPPSARTGGASGNPTYHQAPPPSHIGRAPPAQGQGFYSHPQQGGGSPYMAPPPIPNQAQQQSPPGGPVSQQQQQQQQRPSPPSYSYDSHGPPPPPPGYVPAGGPPQEQRQQFNHNFNTNASLSGSAPPPHPGGHHPNGAVVVNVGHQHAPYGTASPRGQASLPSTIHDPLPPPSSINQHPNSMGHSHAVQQQAQHVPPPGSVIVPIESHPPSSIGGPPNGPVSSDYDVRMGMPMGMVAPAGNVNGIAQPIQQSPPPERRRAGKHTRRVLRDGYRYSQGN